MSERSHATDIERRLRETAREGARDPVQPPAEDAPTSPPDWNTPECYHGTIVGKRLRYFRPKVLALTFDDGPDPEVTPKVLSALRQYSARATFFVQGNHAARYPELLKEIADSGHAIGNHTYTHPKAPSAAQAFTEISRTGALIERTTGRKTMLFRPPYGIVKGESTAEAIRRGGTVVLWTISSADTRPITPEVIASNVIHTPNPGDIVIMHDGPGHGDTAIALEKILAELSAAGYTFVTVPELLAAWDEARREDQMAGSHRLTP